MVPSANQFIETLSLENRVIVIGGLAIIAHGFNRPTKDADIWLDPFSSASIWASTLEKTVSKFQGLTIHTLPGWTQISGNEITTAATEVGMVRILGLDCPLDIFRKPNEFLAEDFDEVHSRATRNSDGTWLPDPIDLAITKDQTNRDKDAQDIAFLEAKIRRIWIEQLATASPELAKSLFDRFTDWKTCEAALKNPHPEVHEIAMKHLREFASDGDPFSKAILENRTIPPA